MQLTELRGYAERMGWQVIEYKEKASSVKRRPVFDQLLADARLRRFDVVLVWKLDRSSCGRAGSAYARSQSISASRIRQWPMR
jgi:DNA invertase Pin-like site-specific DNA recombinase